MIISVITTFHNSEDFILDSLQSFQKIKKQNLVEHLLVNDGSNDNSLNIIQENKSDNQILLGKMKIGRGYALNLAINNAKGKFICILDSDDLLNHKWIDFVLETITNDATLADKIIFGNVIHFKASRIPEFNLAIDNDYSMRLIRSFNLYFKNSIPHVGTLVPVKQLNLVNNYTESRTAQFDWDLWLKLEKIGSKFCYIDTYVAAKRLHSKQSFERKSHISYTMKGIYLQISKTFTQKIHLLPLVIPISFLRLLWSFFPQSLRAKLYKGSL